MKRLSFAIALFVSTLATSLHAYPFDPSTCQTQEIVTVCLDQIVVDGDSITRMYVKLGGGSGIVNPYDSLYLGVIINGESMGERPMAKDGGTRGMNPTGDIIISDAAYRPAHGRLPIVWPEVLADLNEGGEFLVDVYFHSNDRYYSRYGHNFRFQF